jgi:putative sigma-54 modulation protein
MQIEFKGPAAILSEALEEHGQRRLAFALSRFEPRLRLAQVRLSDVNGPKGGEDKACRVVIHLTEGGQVLGEDVHADAYQALTGAVDRAARGLARFLDRARDVRA